MADPPPTKILPMRESIRSFFEQRSDAGVAAVYLFGSHAEGRAHRDSDVDVGVLLDPTRPATAREPGS